MDFRSRSKAVLLAVVSSGALGIVLAWRGWGVWSLVAQRIAADILRVVVLWRLCPWRPSLKFNLTALHPLMAYGSRVTLTGFLNSVLQPVYYGVILRASSAATIGFLTRATQFQELPSKTLAAVVVRVAFPALSSIQSDRQRVRRGFQRVFVATAAIAIPLIAGIALAAKPLVLVVLTEKWLPCVPFLQLFCILGALYPVQVVHRQLLMALGETSSMFRMQAAATVLHLIVLAATCRFGVLPIVIGQILVEAASTLLLCYAAGKQISYSLTQQGRDLTPAVAVTIVTLLAMHGAAQVVSQQPWASLLIQFLVGTMVFTGVGMLVRLGPFLEIRRILAQPTT